MCSAWIWALAVAASVPAPVRIPSHSWCAASLSTSNGYHCPHSDAIPSLHPFCPIQLNSSLPWAALSLVWSCAIKQAGPEQTLGSGWGALWGSHGRWAESDAVSIYFLHLIFFIGIIWNLLKEDHINLKTVNDIQLSFLKDPENCSTTHVAEGKKEGEERDPFIFRSKWVCACSSQAESRIPTALLLVQLVF